MSPIAIPSAPPPATASVGNGSASATSDSHFDDALQQAKAKPKPDNDNGSSDDTTTTPKQAGHTSKDDADRDQKDDKPASSDAKTPPAPIAALPPAPAVTRQAPAATGKALPAATTPTAAIAAAAAKVAPAPVPAPAPAPAAAATAIDKALASHAKPATGAQPTNASVDSSSADTASDRDAAPPAQSLGLAIDPRSIADSGKDATPLRIDSSNFTAHLSQLIGGQAAPTANPAPASAPAQLTMQAPPTQPQFAQETAQHVAWMVGQGIQKAEIQLNPRTLGPIHVDITTHHDHVDVSFAVQHPQTVNALQQTLPQLHDMLAQQGLNLGQASVGQQSPGQQHAAFAQHHSGGGNAGGNTGNAEPELPPVWRSVRIAAPGGVDDFA